LTVFLEGDSNLVLPINGGAGGKETEEDRAKRIRENFQAEKQKLSKFESSSKGKV
jgi:hypothetical protein